MFSTDVHLRCSAATEGTFQLLKTVTFSITESYIQFHNLLCDIARKCLISTCLLAEHQGGYEAARGRHEADRGQHEADRGRHEAELWNEDIRYMWFPVGPNSLSLG
ncbi:hypothetical protein T4C_1411 [Trichinella pseudospiralis]|uniref:Uncharacterized protein n=1 Tax=Trichinella pseudospiralis TaxID=6337 RepID=A0A0V1JQ81_TRIPS|nr:hypothetical protein T4C_1411 [Trichinella pseudospiralis]